MLFARDNSMATPAPANGSERVLVTWTELDDPHWFGARMAGKVVSVETAGAGFRPLQIP
jgi:hypothetical protein